EEEEVTPPVGEPQYGGTLTHRLWWCSSGPTNWDGTAIGGLPGHSWGSPFREHLWIGDIEKYGPRGSGEFHFKAWGGGVPDRYLKGVLAENWEWATPLTLVINLRQGVMWTGNEHIGMESREFTAYDAEFAMNHAWDAYLDQGKVELFDWIDSITATDRYTLVMELNEFYAGLMF
ncbi:unnamed protein product, partial [marine sediment metagenome]